MSKVKVFRTAAGQDFIGSLIEETDTTYKVEKVLFVAIRDGGGKIQVELMPIMPPILGDFEGQLPNQEPTVEFNRGSIVFTYNPTEDLIEHYSKRTSTIQIASSIGNIPNPKHLVDDM